jgi:hypothetical protein
VPIHGETGHRAEARSDRRVTGDDPAAVEALAQDHVVDLTVIKIGYGRDDNMLRQLVSVGGPQRALHRGADGRTQGGHNDGVRHGCLRFV